MRQLSGYELASRLSFFLWGEGPDDTASFDANKYRRLVFSNFYTLNFGIFPVPSGDFSFFLGTNLRPRKSYLGQDWNTALGYQLTLSVGGADVLYGSSDAVQSQFGDSFIGPLFYHRHALMAQGLGMGEISTLAKETMAVAREYAGSDVVDEVVASVPGLSQFV